MHVRRRVYAFCVDVFGLVGVSEPGHSCTPWGEGRGISLSEPNHSQMNCLCSRLSTQKEKREEGARGEKGRKEPGESGGMEEREGDEIERHNKTDRRWRYIRVRCELGSDTEEGKEEKKEV